MKRNQWAAALFALVLFCCGIAVGVLADRYYTSNVVMAKAQPSAADFRRHYVAEMRSRLNLTPEQVEQLQKILDETKAKFQAVRDKDRPEMERIHNEQISRVKSILTARQIPIYEELVREHEREHEQHVREQQQREREEEQKEHAMH